MHPSHPNRPCGHSLPRPTSRREMLSQAAHGFGGVAAAVLLGGQLSGESVPEAFAASDSSVLATRPTHHRPKAKRVIFLYMDGGPSQVDTFDPKPALAKYNGQDPHRVFKVEPTTVTVRTARLLQNPACTTFRRTIRPPRSYRRRSSRERTLL